VAEFPKPTPELLTLIADMRREGWSKRDIYHALCERGTPVGYAYVKKACLGTRGKRGPKQLLAEPLRRWVRQQRRVSMDDIVTWVEKTHHAKMRPEEIIVILGDGLRASGRAVVCRPSRTHRTL